MNTMIIPGKKGVVTLVLAMGLVILALIVTMVIHGIFQQYIMLTKKQLTDLQNYYYAEFGVYRAKWLIDGGHVVNPSYNIPNSGLTGNITVTQNGSVFTIVAAAAGKTITTTYEDGNMTSWN